MFSEAHTRELLIDSCHSSSDADQRLFAELNSGEFVDLLVRIAVDAEGYLGDAPMQAAYYLTRTDPQLTRRHEEKLNSLLVTADGYAGLVAIVLGRLRSALARPVIQRMAAEGYWPSQLFAEALSLYDNERTPA